MKVVHVQWKDSGFGQDGWLRKSDFKEWAERDVPLSNSVGILAYESDDHIVLLQSIGEDQVADGLKILRSSIQLMTQIGELSVTLEPEDS